MDENELCAKVSRVDPKIRFSGLINNKGRLVAGGMVGSVKSLEDEKEDEMLFMELALRVKMRQEFDKDFGKVTCFSSIFMSVYVSLRRVNDYSGTEVSSRAIA